MTTQDEKAERGFTLPEDPKPDAPDATDAADAGALPRIDFASFVLSLATSALYHMGISPDPSGERLAEPNLPLARQTIDTLEMLEEKTRGNLDEEEKKLVETVLYELRMGFVQVDR